jgi:MtN3 and saliva related transmembrane protein
MFTVDVELIGFAAGVLTTVAFAPQVLRTWRLGGFELSWTMLSLFATGVSLWLVLRVSARLNAVESCVVRKILLLIRSKISSREWRKSLDSPLASPTLCAGSNDSLTFA